MEKEFNHGKIIDVNISKEMKTSFLDYSMSVIVARALPDVKDGLKPVHRRILYAMNSLGIIAEKPHKKSARIVGEVIGKYHPHGDSAVYETMVRMAQEFSYRYPLVDGHGNFGSIDGDGAAAMRYTEARMSKIAMEMVKDINKNTIDWTANYDGEEKEPVLLPAKFPNLLVNGTTGIAVGMATNIPPHNLGETIDATIAIMENPEITSTELMENHIFGPDFPTGGYILGRSGIRQAFETGRGSIVTRAKVKTENLPNGKTRIIVYEIPYQVNKANLVEKIANLVRDKMIEGITDLTDESNRNGIRIVMELRKDSQPEVILNQLYKMTSLQTSFGVNTIVLVNNKPMQLGLKEVLKYYIDHQIDVIVRRTKFDLEKAEARAHILEGFKIAINNIDEVLRIIRHSKDTLVAQTELMSTFSLSEIQAKAILDMQFKRLTGLEIDKIELEYNELIEIINDLKDILANHSRVVEIIKKELLDIKARYNDPRRSEIIEGELNVEDEDLIPVSDIMITMTTEGYIKRLSTDTYRLQNRGGRGVKGMSVNEEDIIEHAVSMSTHDYLMLFTDRGRVYRIKGYMIPESGRTAKGIPVVNLLNIEKEEKIKTILPVKKDDSESKNVFFITRNGLVKRVALEEFANIRQTGKIAISLKDDDQLVECKLTKGNESIIIVNSNGKAVKFNEELIRVMGRTASGVRGMNIDGGHIIGMASSTEGNYLFVISENGYGKKTSIDEYRETSRGAKGVKVSKITDKTGSIAAIKVVNGEENCLIMTNAGVVIKIKVDDISVLSRSTQGVRLIKPQENTVVSTITIVNESQDESIDEEVEETTEN